VRKFAIFSWIFAIAFGLILNPIGALSVNASQDVSVSAEAFALIDEFGNILFENNAHTRLPMASTTKIMTAMVALDFLELDQIVSIPAEAVGIEGSSAYFKAGERLKVNDLLHALLLQSANDSAMALAIAATGSVERFCDAMNEKAKSFGLVNTHFDNPHGLDSESHYTTAYELALITAKAIEDPKVSAIMSKRKYTCVSEQRFERVFVNHNKLLSIYEYCIGGKTGYTKADGRCLATAAEHNGVRLIAATLDAPNDWDDHQRLYRAGFALYEEQKLCDAFEYAAVLDVVGSSEKSVTCHNTASVYAHVLKGCEISALIELDSFEYAPIYEGQSVGRVVFLQNGNEIASAELLAKTEAREEKREEKAGFWDKIIKFFRRIYSAIFK